MQRQHRAPSGESDTHLAPLCAIDACILLRSLARWLARAPHGSPYSQGTLADSQRCTRAGINFFSACVRAHERAVRTVPCALGSRE